MNLNFCVSLSSRIGAVASRLTYLNSRIGNAVSRCMGAIALFRNATSRKRITSPDFGTLSPGEMSVFNLPLLVFTET